LEGGDVEEVRIVVQLFQHLSEGVGHGVLAISTVQSLTNRITCPQTTKDAQRRKGDMSSV
jgi:hypothetical protein